MKAPSSLNEKEIEDILAPFNIQDISSFQLLSGGSENTNYLIKARCGNYVLSICEQKTKKQAEELAHLLNHLEASHFNTSKIIPSKKNEVVIIWEGKPVMVKEYIEGKIQQDLPPHFLNAIGKELAKLHQVPPPAYLPQQLNYGKEQFEKIKQYAANSEFAQWLKKLTDYMQPYFQLGLPKSLIHADVFWNNVIINEDKNRAVIMDFEESVHYYRVFDIGMTIIGTCAEDKTINLSKAKHLLKGYQSETQLLENELLALKAFTIYAGAAMTFWRHQNFNYVKPDPKLFDHYLGLKVLVDYLVEQPDNCFV